MERFASDLRIVVEGGATRRQARPRPRAGEDAKPAWLGPSRCAVKAAAAALLDEFDGLDDWAERCEFLIELGRKAPSQPTALRTEANRVRRCQSTVYLAARARPGRHDVVEFLADSDSSLVQGLPRPVAATVLRTASGGAC